MKRYQFLPHLLLIGLPLCMLVLNSCGGPDKEAGLTESKDLQKSTAASTGWLKEMYSTIIDSTIFNTESLQIVYFRQLNDSASYCLFQLSDQTCSSTFLATQVNRKNKQVTQVEENCDGDFSQPEYSYSDYRYDTLSHTFITTEYKEMANPEYLIVENGNKRFREGYDMDNAKTTLDSMVLIRKVLPDGKISETSK